MDVDMVTTLLPLIIGGAIVPVHLIITVLLLQRPGGRLTAAAWVAGMTTTRLIQGLLIGLLLAPNGDGLPVEDVDDGDVVVSVVLLVVAILMYILAAKAWRHEPDADDPPPRWMQVIGSLTPGRAFAAGAGIIAIGAKFWVFTLGAISAIAAAGPGQPSAALIYLGFVVLTVSLHLVALGAAVVAPTRSAAALDRLAGWLTTQNRPITIAFGLIFGTWFLIQALSGLGIL